MSTDTWLAVSAGATFLLALAAFWVIWQNYNFRRQEKNERLLNEIIEWGLEVSIFSSTSSFTKHAEIRDFQKQRIMIALDASNKFTTLEKRGKYIKQISSYLKDSLGDKVDLTIMNIKERNKLFAESTGIKSVPPLDEITKIIKILKENGETLDSLSADAKKLLALGKNSKALGESVEKVIEEATEIKAKDIS